MPAMRNKLTQGVWGKLLSLSVTLTLLSGSASAQITPGVNTPLQKEQKKLTPEEQKYQEELDKNYNAAQKKIPDQGPADPWGGVRPAPTTKSQSKNGSLTPYHRDSFNKQTPQ